MQATRAERLRRIAYRALPPVVAINFVFLALSFTKWYEGDEKSGVADRLFGSIRVLGWRGDVVWLCLTAAYALVMLCGSVSEWRIEKAAKRTALLSVAWLIGWVIYIVHISHLIYMG